MAISLRKPQTYIAVIKDKKVDVKAYNKDAAFEYFRSLDKNIQYDQILKSTQISQVN